MALTVGVAAPRDSAAPGATPTGDALRSEIDRATVSWHAPAVETKTRVERGQGEVWVLLASTCGTLAEATGDAGAGAAVALAAAAQAEGGAGDARVEPFVAADGVGVLAHGPARAGESAPAHARRLADLAARAFAADPLDADARCPGAHVAARARRARSRLACSARSAARCRRGTRRGSRRSGRRSAWHRRRTTPWSCVRRRCAPGRSASRCWRTSTRRRRRPRPAPSTGGSRAAPARRALAHPCPAPATPRPGTYAVDLPAGATSEALLALPLSPADDAARAAAAWLAAALDGPDGLLAHGPGRTSAGAAPESALARGWSAAVVGAPRSPALVVRLSASEGSLDAAVAQTRALLDRLRQGALREEDRSRASSSLARAALALVARSARPHPGPVARRGPFHARPAAGRPPRLRRRAARRPAGHRDDARPSSSPRAAPSRDASHRPTGDPSRPCRGREISASGARM